MGNPWMDHVKAVQKANPGKSLKEVLKMAGKTYKKQPKAPGAKKSRKTRKTRKMTKKAGVFLLIQALRVSSPPTPAGSPMVSASAKPLIPSCEVVPFICGHRERQ